MQRLSRLYHFVSLYRRVTVPVRCTPFSKTLSDMLGVLPARMEYDELGFENPVAVKEIMIIAWAEYCCLSRPLALLRVW